MELNNSFQNAVAGEMASQAAALLRQVNQRKAEKHHQDVSIIKCRSSANNSPTNGSRSGPSPLRLALVTIARFCK